jgi:hypothetical protein
LSRARRRAGEYRAPLLRRQGHSEEDPPHHYDTKTNPLQTPPPIGGLFGLFLCLSTTGGTLLHLPRTARPTDHAASS